jgi:hypothetical protein
MGSRAKAELLRGVRFLRRFPATAPCWSRRLKACGFVLHAPSTFALSSCDTFIFQCFTLRIESPYALHAGKVAFSVTKVLPVVLQEDYYATRRSV